MKKEDNLKDKKNSEEAKNIFVSLQKREPNITDIQDTFVMTAIKLGIKRGYELGYDKFHVTMCDKCEYRSATCFGPGAYCEECSMELSDEEFDNLED